MNDTIAVKVDRSYQQALDAIADECMAECADAIPDHLKPAWWRRFRKIAEIEIGDRHEDQVRRIQGGDYLSSNGFLDPDTGTG